MMIGDPCYYVLLSFLTLHDNFIISILMISITLLPRMNDNEMLIDIIFSIDSHARSFIYHEIARFRGFTTLNRKVDTE